MRRKLIKQGSGGLTVCLPKKWTDFNKLQPGNEIEIGEKDNNLTISGRGESSEKTKIINISKFNKHQVRSIISSAYKSGDDQIIINSKEEFKPSEISEIINTFTGLEMVEQENNKITIRSFLKQDETEIEKLIIKMFQSAKHILTQITEKWDKVNLDELKFLVKNNLIKIRDLCLREIHLNNYGKDLIYAYYDLVTTIEKITGEMYYLAQYVCANKPKKSEFPNKLISLLEDSYFCYLKKEFDQSNKLWLKVREVSDQYFSPKKMKKTVKTEELVAHYYDLIKLLRHLSSRLISLSR